MLINFGLLRSIYLSAIFTIGIVFLITVRVSAESIPRPHIEPARSHTVGISVDHWFTSLLPSLKRQTSIPILLPDDLLLVDHDARLYPSSGPGDKDSYIIYVSKDPSCKGTTACTVGYLTGNKQAQQLTGNQVQLAHGITGFFVPKNCPGRGCYPASLLWVQHGVTYGISAQLNQEPLVRMANSAIVGGPR